MHTCVYMYMYAYVCVYMYMSPLYLLPTSINLFTFVVCCVFLCDSFNLVSVYFSLLLLLSLSFS